MRGNSGFLRWLLTSYSCTTNRKLLLGCIIVTVMMSSVIAGPLNTRPRRMIRDVYGEFESQSQNITQPTAGTCLHDGSAVPDTSVQCEKKSGCRAIQKTGYCCPDYQCDCERNGKIYANGEKLVDPEEPCKGCYCQGGEILCNKVNCYIRHDCEPKFIAGRCCPEYDNCPPIDSSRPAIMASSTNNPATISLLTTISTETTTSSLAKQQQDMVNSNPLGIKIKEITKPEEIRIIDEKPKQTYQLIKPLDSSANQPKIYEQAPAQSPPALHVSLNGNSASSNTVEIDDRRVPLNAPISASHDGKENTEATAQVSPGLAESSTEIANKLESAEVNLVTNEDAQKIVRHTDSLQMDQAALESISSTTEAEILDKSTSADAGKEVVIVDRNGHTKPITVFGVEGLQRGDELDEALEFEEKKTAAKRSDNPHLHIDTTTEQQSDHSTGVELIYENGSSAGQSSTADSKTVTDIDPVGSSSDDFIRVAVTAKLGESTTEGLFNETHVSADDAEEVYETVYHASGADGSDIEDSQPHGSVFHTVYREPDQHSGFSSSTEGPKVIVLDPIDDDGIMDEQNPAYPTIVDDLSVYQSQVLAAEEDSTLKDEKILPDVLELINSTHSENGTTLVPESWLKERNSSTTEGVLIDDEAALVPELRAPGEPLLIPEWERNITETTTPNVTSVDSLEEESLLPSGDLTEIETSPASGDGPSRLVKEREPTTPKARKVIDIDEDGSGKYEHDPKEDSESLKYQDDSDPSYVKPYLLTGLRSVASAFDEFIKSV